MASLVCAVLFLQSAQIFHTLPDFICPVNAQWGTAWLGVKQAELAGR